MPLAQAILRLFRSRFHAALSSLGLRGLARTFAAKPRVTPRMNEEDNLRKAAEALDRADSILIAAGAGMGVDSGLPDFRGNEGFWKAYPPFAKLGISFVELANPEWFETDPALAWGFYGHRLHMYRNTAPHSGFAALRQIARTKRDDFFVFTSNVDGHFQKAGFEEDRVAEVHGSINYLQCTKQCDQSDVWPATDLHINVDEATMRAEVKSLPRCPCGRLARPNVLMFGDWFWRRSRFNVQNNRFTQWLNGLSNNRKQLVIVELGAGLTVTRVRDVCEFALALVPNSVHLRINPFDFDASHSRSLSLPMGAKEFTEKLKPHLRLFTGS